MRRAEQTSPHTAESAGLIRPIRVIFKASITKLVILAVIFAAVPLILYDQFRQAYADNQRLLVLNSQEQGRLIGRALTTVLMREGEDEPLPDPEALSARLAELAGDELTIRLLLRPAQADALEAFYYVASAPTAPEAILVQEREILARLGVLSRLAPTCAGDMDSAIPYEDKDGATQVVTSITPLTSAAGCWVVVTSHTADINSESAVGIPYWATPEVQTAGIIYALMAVTVMTLFIGIWRGLGRFGGLAREIRTRGAAAPSFSAQNEIPELAGVAAEFDRMVARLQNSSRALKRAAEDNAHAFKTPIAIIRQCLEPLERQAGVDDRRSNRALNMISDSLDRLDGLVASARRMDETEAALIDPPRDVIDFSDVVRRLGRDHADSVAGNRVTLRLDITPGLRILASEELIETVLDNVLDNALGFSPDQGTVRVALWRDGRTAKLVIEDQGPGVDPRDLTRIFDRYFSERMRSPGDSGHMGIGLWVVRRNVEALGGTVIAQNAAGSGLRIAITVPLVASAGDSRRRNRRAGGQRAA